jgi:hypothetical protein
VYEGTGFQAATVRGVVTAVTMLRRHPVPHVIHARVSDGAEWCMGNLGKAHAGLSIRSLALAVEELRSKIPPRAVHASP